MTVAVLVGVKGEETTRVLRERVRELRERRDFGNLGLPGRVRNRPIISRKTRPSFALGPLCPTDKASRDAVYVEQSFRYTKKAPPFERLWAIYEAS